VLQRWRHACADDDECAMKPRPRQARRASAAICAAVLRVAESRDGEHWMYAPSRGRVGGVSVAGGWTDALGGLAACEPVEGAGVDARSDEHSCGLETDARMRWVGVAIG
jgi:hypothetical protein